MDRPLQYACSRDAYVDEVTEVLRVERNGKKQIFFSRGKVSQEFKCISVCRRHFQQTGYQPYMVANPASGELNTENGISPVPLEPLDCYPLH